MIEGFPLPATDNPIDRAFWRATLRGELTIQRCGACGTLRFPPRAMCPKCRSLERDWVPARGEGSVWSFAAPGPPLLPAFEQLVPFVTVLVELDDAPGLRMIGLLLNDGGEVTDPALVSRVAIGSRVRVVFRQMAEDVALPCWQLVDSKAANGPQGDI